jgi:hypothetical protein
VAASDVEVVRAMYELEQPIFNVWEVRDGKPYRLLVFFDQGEARAAAGLEG